MSTLKKQGTVAFLWDFAGKLAKNGLNLIVTIFLARLLEPSDFGLIAMIMVVFGVAQVFSDIGLGGALIQRKKVLNIHYTSVFYFNIAVASILSIALYFSASAIGNFYNNTELTPLVEVMSIAFLLNTFSSIQNTKLRKELNYKLLTIVNLKSSIISAFFGVGAAFYGLGVWSLVVMQLTKSIIYNIIIWNSTSWKPTFNFSLKALFQLWGYGFRMFLSGLLDAIFTRIDYLIIGKIYEAAALGFFQRAKSLNLLVIKYSSQSLMGVLFPILSKIQNDLPKFQNIILKGLYLLCFIVFLLLGSLYLVSEELIIMLFGIKWLPSVEIFQILALSGFAYPMSAILVNVLSSRGNSKDFLKLEIYKKIIISANFFVLYYYGINSFLYGLLVCSILAVSLNILFASKEINLSFFTFAKPMLIQALISTILVFIVSMLFATIDIHYILILILKLILFIPSFILINYIFKTDSYIQLKKEIYPIIQKKLNKRKVL